MNCFIKPGTRNKIGNGPPPAKASNRRCNWPRVPLLCIWHMQPAFLSLKITERQRLKLGNP